MGNAPSKNLPDLAASSSRKHKPSGALYADDSAISPPLAPPLWKNHERFEIISPASDLSNPSNLDRLKRAHNNNKRAQKTPVRERRRTSKVMATRNGTGRLVTNQRTSLPPPDRFYFPSGATANANEMGRFKPEPINEEEIRGLQSEWRRQSAVDRPHKLATRAKQVIQGCLNSHRSHAKLDSIPPSIDVSKPMEPMSEIRQPRVHIRRSTSTGQESLDAVDEKFINVVQFDPTLACHIMTVENPYLHSEEQYFRKLSSKRDNNDVPVVSPQSKVPRRDINEAADGPPSPVALLFQTQEAGQNMHPNNTESMNFTKNDHTAWLQCVLHITEANRKVWIDKKRRMREKRSYSLGSATTETHPASKQGCLISEESLTQVESSRPSSDNADLNINENDNERMSVEQFRKSIESDVQRQLDEQLHKRKLSVAHFRQDVQKDSMGQTISGQLKAVHGHIQEDGMMNTNGIIQQRRRLSERRLIRSKSMPLSMNKLSKCVVPDTSTRNLPPTRRRSSSVPPRKSPSNVDPKKATEIPTLLLMAGWKPTAVAAPLFLEEQKPKKVETHVHSLPALLKLAGWQEIKNSSQPKDQRLSIQSALPRLQRNMRLTLDFKNRVTRKSEPIPKSKPLIGATRSRRNKITNRRTLPSSADSKVNNLQEKRTQASEHNDATQEENQVTKNGACTRTKVSYFASSEADKFSASTVRSGLTAATMLQQTYAIAVARSEGELHSQTLSQGDASTTLYAQQHSMISKTIDGSYQDTARSMMPSASTRLSSTFNSSHRHGLTNLVFTSPTVSICSIDTQQTTDSRSPYPLVSQQAASNANFLFACAEDATKNHLDANGFEYNISTLDSLTRLSGAASSTQPSVTIPTSRRSTLSSSRRSDKSDERHVRFSDVVTTKSPFRDVSSHTIESISLLPGIESRVSDLTDHGDYGQGKINQHPDIDSIPEENPIMLNEEELCLLDVDANNADKACGNEAVSTSVTRWSYPSFDGKTMGVGVTPMRNGSSNGQVTSSPLLRFKEARSKFAGTMVIKKPSPIKRPSSIKRLQGGGLVSSRIAALMAEQKRSSDRADSVYTQKCSKQGRTSADGHKSPMLVNGKVVDSPSVASSQESTIAATIINRERKHIASDFYASSESIVDHQGSPDLFGCITLSKTFDDEDLHHDESAADKSLIGSQDARVDTKDEYDIDDDDEDAFADMLKESDDEETLGESTVSTVINTTRKYSGAVTIQSSFASSQTQQINNCKGSVQSSMSMASQFADGESSVMSRKRLSFASSSDSTAPSTILARAATPMLNFRDDAPVRPVELSHHRPQPGDLVLSPMQRTPMQARKWRALAAAAQEKDRKSKNTQREKSLKERHPNMNIIR